MDANSIKQQHERHGKILDLMMRLNATAASLRSVLDERDDKQAQEAIANIEGGMETVGMLAMTMLMVQPKRDEFDTNSAGLVTTILGDHISNRTLVWKELLVSEIERSGHDADWQRVHILSTLITIGGVVIELKELA